MPNRAARRAAARAGIDLTSAGAAFGLNAQNVTRTNNGEAVVEMTPEMFASTMEMFESAGQLINSDNMEITVNGRTLPTYPNLREFRDKLETYEPMERGSIDLEFANNIFLRIGQLQHLFISHQGEKISELYEDIKGIIDALCEEENVEEDDVFSNENAGPQTKVLWILFKLYKEFSYRSEVGINLLSERYFVGLLKPYVRLMPDFTAFTWLIAIENADNAENADRIAELHTTYNEILPPLILGPLLVHLVGVVGEGDIENGRITEVARQIRIKEKHADFIAKCLHRLGNAYPIDDMGEIHSVLSDIREKYNTTLLGEVEINDVEIPRSWVGDLEPDFQDSYALSALLGCLYELGEKLLQILENDLNKENIGVADYAHGVAMVCPAVGASSWKLFKGVYPKEAMKAYLDNGHPYYSYPFEWDEEHQRWDGEPD